ncbi:hypothetical protein MmTuc01_0034 [Methanosarcina mazei Tuc01]|uniref:Uncharacterized protein n=1 Tax=Methanosarcina mazei Tuc01 TaxID=1236903 RepID=M1QEV2_METMZ|nr:hypothetical protein MmTuc01_0034 [Methanosarcina mazei Tuc01]
MHKNTTYDKESRQKLDRQIKEMKIFLYNNSFEIYFSCRRSA